LGPLDRDLLEVLAGQISVAIENAVLYEQDRQRAEELEQIVVQRTAELVELYQLSQEISYALSLEELLHPLLHHLRKAMQGDLAIGLLVIEERSFSAVEASRPIAPTLEQEIQTFCREVLDRHMAGRLKPPGLNLLRA
jgi:GAF domain-containing protein